MSNQVFGFELMFIDIFTTYRKPQDHTILNPMKRSPGEVKENVAPKREKSGRLDIAKVGIKILSSHSNFILQILKCYKFCISF